MLPKLTEGIADNQAAVIYADVRVVQNLEAAQKLVESFKDDPILQDILIRATSMNIITGASPSAFLKGAVFMYKLLQEAEKEELKALYEREV